MYRTKKKKTRYFESPRGYTAQYAPFSEIGSSIVPAYSEFFSILPVQNKKFGNIQRKKRYIPYRCDKKSEFTETEKMRIRPVDSDQKIINNMKNGK